MPGPLDDAEDKAVRDPPPTGVPGTTGRRLVPCPGPGPCCLPATAGPRAAKTKPRCTCRLAATAFVDTICLGCGWVAGRAMVAVPTAATAATAATWAAVATPATPPPIHENTCVGRLVIEAQSASGRRPA